jgi:FkbM family methyltransferase
MVCRDGRDAGCSLEGREAIWKIENGIRECQDLVCGGFLRMDDKKIGIRNRIFRTVLAIFRFGLSLLGEKNRIRAEALLSEELEPIATVDTERGQIKFLCCGRLPLMRADTFHTKEPETLKWLDAFEEGSVLWDVGANVGQYSFYAALRPSAQVVAFEPSGFNYAILLRNMELNGRDNIIPLCTALSDQCEFGFMNMFNTKVGKSGGSFGEPIDWKGQMYNPGFRQAMISFSIDGILSTFRLPFPNYIKMDVDGNEGKILAGARETLRDERLKSLLVELSPERKDYERTVSMITASGFRLSDMEGKINHIFWRR